MTSRSGMHVDYNIYVGMQNKIKNQEKRIAALESATEFQRLEESNRRIRRYYEGKLQAAQKEIASLHQRNQSNLDMWFEVFEDVQEECLRQIRDMEKQLEAKDKLLRKKDQQIAMLQGKLANKTKEAATERQAKIREEEKNQALKARMGKNSSNSSIPSSQDSFRGKVPNNREKTGKKPGAQSGHEGHKRKQPAHVDKSQFVEAPAELADSARYYRIDQEQVHKKVVDIEMNVVVTDYYADVYRDRTNGARCHATFPGGIQLDVNYGENLKATVFFMKNHLNVSDEKVIEFFNDMTNGEIKLSRGMVNGINREFSMKSKEEQDAIYARLADASVLYVDMTNVRMNGNLKNVVVCSDKKCCMYSYREHKGDEGLKGTPAEVNTHLLVHDHDKTMYHYGKEHQECNEHHLRYLKGAMENEPKLTWHGKMRSLLQEMNRTREAQGRKLQPEQISDFEKRYDSILDLAEEEYKNYPPTKYYRDGFNLYKRLRKYRESVLRFLHDSAVDFTNNEAERCCRRIRRKQVQMGTFRGNTARSAEEYCASMSVLQTWRMSGKWPLQEAASVFRRPWPERKKPEEPGKAELIETNDEEKNMDQALATL